MGDMLVKLYDMLAHSALVEKLRAEGIEFRRALAPEKDVVAAFAKDVFGFAGWKCEVERPIGNAPPSCFVAVQDGKLIGFSCYDTSCKGFFGPTGVHPSQRKRGIGTALPWLALKAMAEVGYGYAIIGWVSSEVYYAKAAGATVIPGSEPGIWKGMLKL
jgi:GNAT superfamily N-acetyltransferase